MGEGKGIGGCMLNLCSLCVEPYVCLGLSALVWLEKGTTELYL